MAKKKTVRTPQKKLDSNTNPEFHLDILSVMDKDEFASANYQRLVGELIRSNYAELNSTGTAIGGTIGSLNRKVETIEQILVKPDYMKKISLIENELKAIKVEILPQLEDSKKALSKIEEFMRNNASFLTDLVSAQGKLRPLESEISALTKRMEKIESEKNLAWNKTTTIISIVIAILGTAFGIYFGFIK